MKTSTVILVIVTFIMSCVNFIFANMRQESFRDKLILLESKITLMERCLDIEYIPDVIYPARYQKIPREYILFNESTLNR